MLRFLVKFLLLAIILVGSVFLFAQWKLEKDINSFAKVISPFAEFKYQSAKIGLSGEVKLSAVSLFINSVDTQIEIGELSVFFGDLFDLAFFESNIQQLKIPEKAHVILRDVLVPFNPTLLRGLSNKTEVTSFDLIQTAYCGAIEQFGVNEIDAMGYEYLFFSSKEFFMLDKYSGSAVINGAIQLEEMFDIEYQMNIGGVMSWLESMQERQFAAVQQSNILPSLSFLDLKIIDKGFNTKKAQYCALKQQVSVEEYYSGHQLAVEKYLAEAGIQLKDSAKKAYQDLIMPGSDLYWFIQPKANFEFDGVGYYSFGELAELSGMKFLVNSQPVTEYFEGWSSENFAKIAISEKAKKIEADPFKAKYQIVEIPKSYQKIRHEQASNYIKYPVRVLRNDGASYMGKLQKTSDTSIWITLRTENGELVIPIARTQIVEFEVYKEELKK